MLSELPNHNYFSDKNKTVRLHKATYCDANCIRKYDAASMLVALDVFCDACPICGSDRIIHKQIKPAHYKAAILKLERNMIALKKRGKL